MTNATSIRVSPGQLPAWVDRTNKRHRAALLRGIHKTTADVESAVKIRTQGISPFPPVDNRIYLMSWKHDNHANGGRVYNDAPHAGIVELGVRPGRIPEPKLSKKGKPRLQRDKKGNVKYYAGTRNRMWRQHAGGSPVPMQAILRWTYRKFRFDMKFKQTRKNPRGRWVKTTVFKTENAAWGLAVAIQRKLHAKGIRGKHVLTHPAFVAKTVRITQDNASRELAKVAP